MTRSIFAAVLFVGACVPALPAAIGDQCQLTSECDAPLVCRIGACRKECATSRDCAAGLDCVLDNDKLGACQLPREAHCILNSDCPAPLVCGPMDHRCANVCTNDRDCPPGAMCVGGTACVDPDRMPCVYNSDCVAMGMKVCAPDQRCRDECVGDTDCRYGQTCHHLDLADAGVVNFCDFFGSDAGTSPLDAGAD